MGIPQRREQEDGPDPSITPADAPQAAALPPNSPAGSDLTATPTTGPLNLLRMLALWPPQPSHKPSSDLLPVAPQQGLVGQSIPDQPSQPEGLGDSDGLVGLASSASDERHASMDVDENAVGDGATAADDTLPPNSAPTVPALGPVSLSPGLLDRPFSPTSVLDPPDWSLVPGLDDTQVAALQRVATHGVVWKNPVSGAHRRFTLHYGGEVDADGNCLFSALHRVAPDPDGPVGLRKRAVHRFLKEYEAGAVSRDAVDVAVKHLYSPDLSRGWGVHMVQEVKMVAPREQRAEMRAAVDDLVQCGMSRDHAIEAVSKERCAAVDCARTWADYMRVGSGVGGAEGETHDVVSLQYTEDGLLSASATWDAAGMASVEGEDGGSSMVGSECASGFASFGDDLAIEVLATELGREVVVVQSHGADVVMDADGSLFFLPHAPRGVAEAVRHAPLFLLMKGTAWCGAGADHYEPILTCDCGEVPAGEVGKSKALVL